MRHTFRASIVLALLAGGCVFPRASASRDDPVLGTWELDLSRSTFQPGPPVLNQTRTFTQTSRGVRFVLEGRSASGAPMRTEFTAPYDGKDYPLTGSPSVNSVSLTRVTRLRTDATERKDGRVVFTVRREISEDGTTMTVTVNGTNAQGQQVANVLVFRRR